MTHDDRRSIYDRPTHRFEDDTKQDVAVMAAIVAITVVLALFSQLLNIFPPVA